jgi:hypothetical protein
MQIWQFLIILVIGILSTVGLILSYRQCKYRNNSYGHPPGIYGFLGAFVWADLVVFGAFWTLVSLLTLILSDWILFLLITSLFWLVRSAGETLYWFHQQFTPNKGNPPDKFWVNKIFKSDAVWFVHQIYWQCISVLTIVTSLYLAKLWLL